MENTKDNTNIWVDISEASKVIGQKEATLKRKCRKGEFVFKIVKKGKVAHYFVLLKSMPDFAQDKYLGETEINIKYSEVPSWKKLQAEKYVRILEASKGLKGKELKDFIDNWNNNEEEEFTTSYPSLIRMRRRYFRYGVAGLISRHGEHLTGSSVTDKYFEYFKSLYLIEGGPSLRSCRDLTLGYAVREDDVDRKTFPSFMAFKRRLVKEVPEQSIFLARYGQSVWNRKYNNFIERDYSNITCNQVWVSDHAQIDVACYDHNNKPVFPWGTVWRDYKSGKLLGWILQTGNPNSDLIFQTFYDAASEFGLPKDVIIDNVKDYRSKDFAGGREPCVKGKRLAKSKTLSPQPIDSDVRVSEGNSTGAKGRKNFKVDTNKNKTSAMLKELNVNVHFALPYNAQTKPVERDFLKIKEMLSKHCVGYRGGNVVERPEKLAKEIKDGKIMKFEDFKKIFDNFITNILNKKPSQGKNLNGKCPDELFYEEVKEKIVPSKDALKLFCSRTSKTYTISKNGIKDGSIDTTYWADWMITKKGTKVYMRRDTKNYKEAWVFNAKNDEFIGKAEATNSVAALYAPEVSKEEFEAAMATKKRNIKVTKSYIKQNKEISAMEKYQNYETAYQSVEREYKKPVKVSKIANTSIDKAIQKNKDMESYGKADLSIFLPEKEKKKFYHWETEKYLDEPEEELYLYETDRMIAEQQKKRGCG